MTPLPSAIYCALPCLLSATHFALHSTLYAQYLLQGEHPCLCAAPCAAQQCHLARPTISLPIPISEPTGSTCCGCYLKVQPVNT
jgi:hypothetical protein